jgi:uncharacterized protein
MNFTTPILLAMAILFISTFIRSAIGFGDALVAMPLLAMALGIQTATPLVAFAAATIALIILIRNWRSVDIRSAWRLILLSLVGIPFGLVLLREAPEQVVKAILGVLLILYGLYSLITPSLPVIRSERSAYIFGFIAGVLGGAYNTNGPPVVMYGLLRRWPPESFRATLQCYFLFTGVSILISHGVAGLWTPLVLQIYLYSIPIIMLAIFAGGRINNHISKELFSRIVYAFLIVIGAIFLI